MNKNQMKSILSNLPDFQNQQIGMRTLLELRGHILIVSPKCHPELAGSGIEYCWGIAGINFGNILNKNSQNVRGHIARVLGPEILSLSRDWKYERKSRDYMRLYYKMSLNGHGNLPTNYEEIERMRKIEKTRRSHRQIFDIERSYISNS
jgi:hypothetical protein